MAAHAGGAARVSADRVPKLAAMPFDEWFQRMGALLRSVGLHDVVANTVFVGTVEERARSRGRANVDVVHVADEAVLRYIAALDVSDEEAASLESAVAATTGGKKAMASTATTTAASSSKMESSASSGGVDDGSTMKAAAAASSKAEEDAVKKVKAMKKDLVRRSEQAYELLLSALNGDMVAVTGDVTAGDANALWVAVQRHQLKARSSADEVARLKGELATLRLKKNKNGEREKVVDFIARIKALVAKLQSVQIYVDNLDVALRFLSALKKFKRFHLGYKLARRAVRRGKVQTLDDVAVDFLEQDEDSEDETSSDVSDSSEVDDDDDDDDDRQARRGKAKKAEMAAAVHAKSARGALMDDDEGEHDGEKAAAAYQPYWSVAGRGGARGCGSATKESGRFGSAAAGRKIWTSAGRGGWRAGRGGIVLGGGGRGGGSGRRCFNCGETGHIAAECETGQTCFNCGGRGHVAPVCPSKTNTRRTGGRLGDGDKRAVDSNSGESY